MSDEILGLVLDGDRNLLRQSFDELQKIPVDWDMSDQDPMPIREERLTIKEPVTLRAPGTFSGKETRTLRLEPTQREGWFFDRTDLPESMPVRVSIRNVWTTGDLVSNIVLRSGSSHNYIRLVEHIIALKLGSDIDNLMIKIDSGDPPLFEKGSLDLTESLSEAGRIPAKGKVRYFTVKERVSVVRENGSFLILSPCGNSKSLNIDCAVDFPNAIGQQRIKFPVNLENFHHGCVARTNTTFKKILFCKTIGWLFADIRNLGYNKRNVQIASKTRYLNEPQLIHNGKCLEAVWHRSTLDLLAGLALIEEGRFLGNVISYRAGHFLDVEMIRLLYNHDLLTEVEVDQD